jgi:hypothetical protein
VDKPSLLSAVGLDAVLDEAKQLVQRLELRDGACAHVLGAAGEPAFGHIGVGAELHDEGPDDGRQAAERHALHKVRASGPHVIKRGKRVGKI